MLLPNQLTVLRIILTPFVVYFLVNDSEFYNEIALVLYLIAALTDWYDGWLARKFNYFSNWGRIWDPIADKILTAGTLLSLVYLQKLMLIPVVLILLRDFLITGLRAYADYLNKPFPTSRYAKFKTVVQLVFINYVIVCHIFAKMSLFPVVAQDIFRIMIDYFWINIALGVVTLITLDSGLRYVFKHKKLIVQLFSKENRIEN
ncbi:MAG: CDP-diacylglycerol--glycerol-3-phosphate 3-phosphatidyltransferase [Ignavibacteriaceae bacterium]|nr:CDP-diacylglycerol--glycerol-3-phosphate 3-phosphatidyltransferase [Ignavibacteriaceae bacterium]